MSTARNFKHILILVVAAISLALSGCIQPITPPAADASPSSGLTFVDYRHLNGGADGVALIDLDPESADFGKIIQQVEMGEGVLPHHLYFNRDESKLYNTALAGERLYELSLERDENGVPTITGVTPIDVGVISSAKTCTLPKMAAGFM